MELKVETEYAALFTNVVGAIFTRMFDTIDHAIEKKTEIEMKRIEIENKKTDAEIEKTEADIVARDAELQLKREKQQLERDRWEQAVKQRYEDIARTPNGKSANED